MPIFGEKGTGEEPAEGNTRGTAARPERVGHPIGEAERRRRVAESLEFLDRLGKTRGLARRNDALLGFGDLPLVRCRKYSNEPWNEDSGIMTGAQFLSRACGT